jgi:anthranilate phosphoribosyltransferase
MKGETVEELVAFAQVMRENCLQIHPKVRGRLVDTCGTGGDKIKTFNISTASAFVVAGAGVSIAKHGNRSVTSKSGSADVLEHLGLNLGMTPEAVKEAIEEIGIGFMFAPAFHPAMKYAVAPRKEVGIRTVFNLLGPLTNPACANAQLLGVYDAKLVGPLANALCRLGCEEAMVVHGLSGLDEISTLGKTVICHLRNGETRKSQIAPKDLGLKRARLQDLLGGSSEENAYTLVRILNGNCSQQDPKTEIVLANSAAAILVGGKAETLKEGLQVAGDSIRSGAALGKLEALVKFSCGDPSKLEELLQA